MTVGGNNVIGWSAYVGEPMYVVNDAGFRRHIPSEQVDRVVLSQIAGMMNQIYLQTCEVVRMAQ